LRQDPIVIADYDPAWPEAFERERAAIESALGDAIPSVVAIEHFGSTAVAGLAAKPVIDIMIGVQDVAAGVPCITPLVDLGYQCMGESGIPGRIFFRKGQPRSHHVHVLPFGGQSWNRHLAFRDLLRQRPDLAEKYARTKRELAASHGADRMAYTEAKTPFIEAALAES
jgi:GrpB-like predicted nucleotidyltransferase (UPF0157 family)